MPILSGLTEQLDMTGSTRISFEEVQEKATHWLWHYNNERPNMALGGYNPYSKAS